MFSKAISSNSPINDACTLLMIGKNASNDGSTIMVRTVDFPPNNFFTVKYMVMNPKDHPINYKTVTSGCEIKLPENPMRYTQLQFVNREKYGIWGEAGINEVDVSISATETISSNERVQGADPLMKEKGIGEEDFLTVCLPYIKSAKEGVLRLGSLLETYGTYEMNGVGFQDENEIWYLETIGGHHWIAKRVPDDAYVINPNQQGIKEFDLVDAFGEQKNHLCSKDLIDFIKKNNLDLEGKIPVEKNTKFNARFAFGSHSDFDHTYNTPRAFITLNYFNPKDFPMDEVNVQKTFECDNLPWNYIPEHKITIEEVKNIMSNVFHGTKYDPYSRHGDLSYRGKYRFIGINRTGETAITQIRGGVKGENKSIQWVCFGSTPFSCFIPQYIKVSDVPAYLRDTTDDFVNTETFYWNARLVAALSDSHMQNCRPLLDSFRNEIGAKCMEILNDADEKIKDVPGTEEKEKFLAETNERIVKYVKERMGKLLKGVLDVASNEMKNRYARSDA